MVNWNNRPASRRAVPSLRRAVVRMATAEIPDQGLAAAASERPALILLDLVLPKRQGLAPALNKEAGFSVLERLKQDPATKGSPVVVFTNLDEENEGNVERVKALGAADYWVKAKHQPAEVVKMVKGRLQRTATPE